MRRLRKRYGHAAKQITASSLRVGDVVHVQSESGLSTVDAKIVAKHRGRRSFSRGAAFDLVVERVAPAHPSDLGKQWKVYVLGEDKITRQS